MTQLNLIANAKKNITQDHDRSFHSWYQFVLGYPPHLVREYVQKFQLKKGDVVLDPFCGTGTTNVECKKLSIESLGLEANPIACLAASVKVNWTPDPARIQDNLRTVVDSAAHYMQRHGLVEPVLLRKPADALMSIDREPELTVDQLRILPKGFISALPLRRLLILRAFIDLVPEEDIRNMLLVALASEAVNHASNIAFGPEVYAGKPKVDVHVLSSFEMFVEAMAEDLLSSHPNGSPAHIRLGDARTVGDVFPEWTGRIAGVITSPPYPNEKDYTRTTRLETILLGLARDRGELRALKDNLLRSNSRTVFVTDTDAQFVSRFPSITRIAEEIEQKRIRLGKTSGFERLYPRIVTHYFGGMYRHLQSVKKILAPGARLAYVVGDQMSFFRTHIPTALLLGEIAEDLGYSISGIDLWRTRLATATRRQIDENVLLLRN